MRIASLLVALLTVPVLQGCLGLGGGDEGDDGTLYKNRADVSDSTGGIEGVVTDNAVAPVAGVAVTIAELAVTAPTADDGSYAFSTVRPGTYTLVIEAAGFVPATQTVEVHSGVVATADFVLVHLASDLPYHATLELAGFFECGVGAGFNRSQLPLPAPYSAATLAACAVPNSYVANSTNDRFRHTFDLDAPVHEVVFETTWSSGGSPVEKAMWITVDLTPYTSTAPGAYTFFQRTEATSPFREVINRTEFEQKAEWLKDQCDDGDENGCISPFDSGWPLSARFFTSWNCLGAPAGACAPAQVAFTHYVTTFYNASGPAGFSALAQTSP